MAHAVLSTQVRAVSAEWNSRAELPAHVVNLIANFPTTMHPMTQLIAAVTCLQTDSKFAQAYSEKKITKVCVCLCVCARTRMHAYECVHVCVFAPNFLSPLH